MIEHTHNRIATIASVTRKALVRTATIRPYGEKIELGPMPVCASCLGNIYQGAAAAGGCAMITRGELVDEECEYCGLSNSHDIERDQIHWIGRNLTKESLLNLLWEHDYDFHSGERNAQEITDPQTRPRSRHAAWCRACSLEKKQ